jgi:hypothetical protein
MVGPRAAATGGRANAQLQLGAVIGIPADRAAIRISRDCGADRLPRAARKRA